MKDLIFGRKLESGKRASRKVFKGKMSHAEVNVLLRKAKIPKRARPVVKKELLRALGDGKLKDGEVHTAFQKGIDADRGMDVHHGKSSSHRSGMRASQGSYEEREDLTKEKTTQNNAKEAQDLHVDQKEEKHSSRHHTSADHKQSHATQSVEPSLRLKKAPHSSTINNAEQKNDSRSERNVYDALADQMDHQ